MTVSSKQISVAIIVAFFAGILGYFLFWFGYVEIFINHAEVEKFQVKTREKIYQCDKNPCRIKVRAGNKFVGQVDSELAENKKIFVAKVPLLKTEKVVIQAKEVLEDLEIQKISKKSLSSNLDKFFGKQSSNLDFFGPVLVAENGKFSIFSRDFDGKLKIYIKNKNSEQLLTEIEDDFSPIFLEKNFSLTENGIVIPAKNRVYYYDFATQRKFKILEINSLRLANISVSADGKEVIFYNLKEKKWQKKNIDSNNPPLFLGEGRGEVFAGFWNGKLLEIRGNTLYLNGKGIGIIPLQLEKSNKIYLWKNNLIIEQDFEVWEVEL